MPAAKCALISQPSQRLYFHTPPSGPDVTASGPFAIASGCSRHRLIRREFHRPLPQPVVELLEPRHQGLDLVAEEHALRGRGIAETAIVLGNDADELGRRAMCGQHLVAADALHVEEFVLGGHLAYLSGAWQTVKGKFSEGLAFVQGLGSRFLAMGKNLILGLARGITSAPGAVFEALKGVVMGGVSRIKNLLGIKSPSRLFMGFGNYLSQGMAIGIDQKRQQAFASARRLATGVAGAAVLGAPAVAGAAGSGTAGAAAAPVSISAPITIVQRPGEDNQDLANRVRLTIEQLAREDQARRNSSYADG